MTGRERVMAAFAFEETDRVPIDLSGHRSSGVSALLYSGLRNHLGLPVKPVRVYDPVQQLAIVDNDILDLFGIDTIELGRGFALDEASWARWSLPDGTSCTVPKWALPEREEKRWVIRSRSGRIIAQMVDGSPYFEQTVYPLAEAEHMDLQEAMDECMWCAVASPPGPGVKGHRLREGAARFRASTGRAILGLFGGNLLEMGQFLFGNDRFLMMLALEPERVHDFLERLTRYHLASLEAYLDAVVPYIDILVFGDDLGMQTGPQISPAMYREFFKPHHASLWNRAKEYGVKVMLHCCGGVLELLPDLIDAGLDAINPVQISARGMKSSELKRKFGKRLVFWGGGCDTQTVLPLRTRDEVKSHVIDQLKIWAPGGGFVFQQVHNILQNVPVANVEAMLRTVNRWRIHAA